VSNKKQAAQKNQIRIIGGEWRGRKLSFPDLPGLRPTSDRIRETLFNWLQLDIIGSDCLDLFAGSGALGFEALSRGAKSVTFVDSHLQSIKQLWLNANVLGTNAEIVQKDALAYLTSVDRAFDVIFLDPPFNQELLSPSLKLVHERSLLKTDAKVYVESEIKLDFEMISDKWRVIKDKKAGNVFYYLLCLAE